jgi:hypothetical protein
MLTEKSATEQVADAQDVFDRAGVAAPIQFGPTSNVLSLERSEQQVARDQETAERLNSLRSAQKAKFKAALNESFLFADMKKGKAKRGPQAGKPRNSLKDDGSFIEQPFFLSDVLKLAATLLDKSFEAVWSGNAESVLEEIDWIFTQEEEGLSFDNSCRLVGMNPNVVRELLIEYRRVPSDETRARWYLGRARSIVCKYGKKKAGPEEFWLTYEWILSPGVEPFSFLDCCALLGIDSQEERTGLLRGGILPSVPADKNDPAVPYAFHLCEVACVGCATILEDGFKRFAEAKVNRVTKFLAASKKPVGKHAKCLFFWVISRSRAFLSFENCCQAMGVRPDLHRKMIIRQAGFVSA